MRTTLLAFALFFPMTANAQEPPLGRFVRELRDDITDVNHWRIKATGPHQCYYRAEGGVSGRWQRCLFYVDNVGGDPDGELGGRKLPQDYTPTRWAHFARFGDSVVYHTLHQFHRNGRWRYCKGTRITVLQYTRGTLFVIGCEGTGDTYDDYIVELAIVNRPSTLDGDESELEADGAERTSDAAN